MNGPNFSGDARHPKQLGEQAAFSKNYAEVKLEGLSSFVKGRAVIVRPFLSVGKCVH